MDFVKFMKHEPSPQILGVTDWASTKGPDEGMSAYPEEKLDTQLGKRNAGTPILWYAIRALE